MANLPSKNLYEVIRDQGKYPPDAFRFVQEGLAHAVQEVHGDMTEDQRLIHQFMSDNSLDFDQLQSLHFENQLPDEVNDLLDQTGGLDELNRHISGQNLCWGLRNFALERFGAMASAVLTHWNIRRTRDFGEIVFTLVDNNFLQKQSHDTLDDFEDVFQFEEAFDRSFKITLPDRCN